MICNAKTVAAHNCCIQCRIKLLFMVIYAYIRKRHIFFFVKYTELYDITEEKFVDGEIEKRNSTKIMKRILLLLLVVVKKK